MIQKCDKCNRRKMMFWCLSHFYLPMIDQKTSIHIVLLTYLGRNKYFSNDYMFTYHSLISKQHVVEVPLQGWHILNDFFIYVIPADQMMIHGPWPSAETILTWSIHYTYEWLTLKCAKKFKRSHSPIWMMCFVQQRWHRITEIQTNLEEILSQALCMLMALHWC